MAARAMFHPDGRIRGSYVYMLVCRNSDGIHIKVGMSDNPLNRLGSLLTACPLKPGVLATVELPNRPTALRFEKELHCALEQWRHVGEWFLFKPTDKPAFNAAIRSAAVHFAKPAWPMRWQKHSVAALLAQARQRKAIYQGSRQKRGRAFEDFEKAGGRSL